MASSSSPRDRFITVYGRMPVIEALARPATTVDKLLVADGARGENLDRLLALAAGRGVEVRRVPAGDVTKLSRNGRHDQGVVADVLAPRMRALEDWLAALRGPARLLILDGVTNPANVGMVLRTATAAGLEGVVLPRAGVAEVGPLVVKASAGVAFDAPILRVATVAAALDAVRTAGFARYGLAGDGTADLWTLTPGGGRLAFVLGSETDGLSAAARDRLEATVAIPLATGVESLNVAAAAAVVSFELARRARAGGRD